MELFQITKDILGRKVAFYEGAIIGNNSKRIMTGKIVDVWENRYSLGFTVKKDRNGKHPEYDNLNIYFSYDSYMHKGNLDKVEFIN